MQPVSGRRRFLQVAALAAGSAAAERLLPAAGALAADPVASVPAATPLVELQPVFSEAAFPERSHRRPFRYGAPNLGGASGVAASYAHPGVFWVVRDGFRKCHDRRLLKFRSYLYAVRFDAAQGQLVRWEPGVPQTCCDGYVKYLRIMRGGGPLPRGDIEDLALAPGAPGAAGTLWLGDFGNNTNASQPGRLHRLPEPDPVHDVEVAVQESIGFWSQPDHRGPQANFEALFVAGGVPYAVVKSCPPASGIASGQVLRLPTAPGPGGAAVDAVPVAALVPAAGAAWRANNRPNGADLRDNGLLLSTGTAWLRYQADAGLTGDALVRDLAAAPPVEGGWWQAGGAPSGNEAIGWLAVPGSPSFLALSETGLFRWRPG